MTNVDQHHTQNKRHNIETPPLAKNMQELNIPFPISLFTQLTRSGKDGFALLHIQRHGAQGLAGLGRGSLALTLQRILRWIAGRLSFDLDGLIMHLEVRIFQSDQNLLRGGTQVFKTFGMFKNLQG